MKTHYTLPATLAALVLLVLPAGAQAAGCPNEEFRTGPSASLPDCRAYELVTPEELGRTQAMTFTTADHAVSSLDGEHLALETFAPLEPNPNLKGTRAVYSRTPHGWTAMSLVPPGSDASQFETELFSPDLSQVALRSFTAINPPEEQTIPRASEVGPVGGPYARLADFPSIEYESVFAGANAGTASVPAFADVLLESTSHELLPEGPEREIAEKTAPGANDLYDWTEGRLRLVNVEGEGSNLKLLNTCGALLGPGHGAEAGGANTAGAVSADGSKIFFTSCGRLYMRVDDRETVEVSVPAPGVKPEYSQVRYNGASADGSEVVFNTYTPLLEGETDNENKLFIYDTVTPDLKLIESGVDPDYGTAGRFVLVSKDGSAVYYESNESVYRYDTRTGEKSFIAEIHTPSYALEPSYTTPNGQFLVFVGGPGEPVEVAGPHGPEPEPRGAGHNELYRYDAATGNVMCVSCGEGIAPAEGEVLENEGTGALETEDETPPFIRMSEDGQRVFFQTTAQLVPQDTNSPKVTGASTGGVPGMDVYEWEEDGTEEAPGVVCGVANGCTHLLSTGEDVGKATFLGASENGDNVFFATEGQLLPQVDGEFPNIYDARVDGGFPPPRGEPECLSCQGVGAPAPLFSPGASGTFVGPANVTAPAPATATSTRTKTKTKTVKCGKRRVKSKGRCVEVKHGKKVKRASRGARR